MTVRRTLPQKQRSLIGAWCFLDHFGPDPVAATGGMKVPRHPHTGLATVTWLFTGFLDHRDSAGYQAVVRPGEINLMVAGRGISHQEFSTPDTDVLHGVQLWCALPEATRHMAPTFEHHAPSPVTHQGAEVRVFIGSLAGCTSPVRTYTPPLLGAEIILPPHQTVTLDLDERFEHGVLLDIGEVLLDKSVLLKDHLVYSAPGRTTLTLQTNDTSARIVLIGGEPLNEKIVMWWNFIGRHHDEIEAYRAAWQAEIGMDHFATGVSTSNIIESGTGHPDGSPHPRFGPYPPGLPPALPAPALPAVRLNPRG